MPAAPRKIKAEVAHKVADALVNAWFAYAGLKKYPQFEPGIKPIEAWFDKYVPEWKAKLPSLLKVSGHEQEVGFLPVFILAALAAKPIVVGGAVVLTAALAALAALYDNAQQNKDKIKDWAKKKPPRGDPPIKGKDGKPVDPWYVGPINKAITAAAVAAVAGLAVREAGKFLKAKVPRIPTWLIPAAVLGGLGVWAWTARKKAR